MKPELSVIECGRLPEAQWQKVLHKKLAIHLANSVLTLQIEYPLLADQEVVSALRDWFSMERFNRAFDKASIERAYSHVLRLLKKFAERTNKTLFFDGTNAEPFNYQEIFPPKLDQYIELHRQDMRESYEIEAQEAAAKALLMGELDFPIARLIIDHRKAVAQAVVMLLLKQVDLEATHPTMLLIKEAGIGNFYSALESPDFLLEDTDLPPEIVNAILAARSHIRHSSETPESRLEMAEILKSTRFRPVVLEELSTAPEEDQEVA